LIVVTTVDLFKLFYFLKLESRRSRHFCISWVWASKRHFDEKGWKATSVVKRSWLDYLLAIKWVGRTKLSEFREW